MMEIIFGILGVALYLFAMAICIGLLLAIVGVTLFGGGFVGFFNGVFKGIYNYFSSLFSNLKMRRD